MSQAQGPSSLNARLEAALRRVYPRLLAHADRLLRARRVHALEAGDLCQEGALAATVYLRRLPPERLDALNEDGLRAILYTVATRTMHGRLVDHVRALVVRRRDAEAPMTDDGGSFARQQEARLALSSLMRQAKDSERKALMIAVETGEVDPAGIADRLGFSRGHAYRLLKNLTDRAGGEP